MALSLVAVACSPDSDEGLSEPGRDELHVSAEDGDDGASGSDGEPFATISACAAVVQPGQTCVVEAGTYRETVRPGRSGTPDAPIRFQADGDVTITGTDVLEGWTESADGAYERTVEEEVTQLFVDDRLQVEARWPNLEGTLIEPNLAAMDQAVLEGEAWTITDADLDVDPAVVEDSRAWVLPGMHWVANSGPITAVAGTAFTTEFDATINVDTGGVGPLAYSPQGEDPYFLFGHRGLLDAEGEWFYDSNTSTAAVRLSDDPRDLTVEGRTRTYAIDLADRSNIELSGFDIHAGSVRIDGDDNRLDTCTVHYATPFFAPTQWGGLPEEGRGVEIAGEGNVVRGCEIAHSWGGGITFEGDSADTVVADNIIHDVNWSGSRASTINLDAGGNRESSMNDEVTENTLCGAGRSGITHRLESEDLSITHNDISRVGMINQDLGAIYSFAALTTNTEIAWNRVHDLEENFETGAAELIAMNGIYVDNEAAGISVHHNEIWNVPDALHVNSPARDVTVANNTVWDIDQVMPQPLHGGPNVDPGDQRLGDPEYEDVLVVNNLVIHTGDEALPEPSWWGNVTAPNLITDDSGVVVDLTEADAALVEGSAAVDAGVEVKGVTDGFMGTAPDLGANELGTKPFQAGAGWAVTDSSAQAPASDMCLIDG